MTYHFFLHRKSIAPKNLREPAGSKLAYDVIMQTRLSSAIKPPSLLYTKAPQAVKSVFALKIDQQISRQVNGIRGHNWH